MQMHSKRGFPGWVESLPVFSHPPPTHHHLPLRLSSAVFDAVELQPAHVSVRSVWGGVGRLSVSLMCVKADQAQRG